MSYLKRQLYQAIKEHDDLLSFALERSSDGCSISSIGEANQEWFQPKLLEKLGYFGIEDSKGITLEDLLSEDSQNSWTQQQQKYLSGDASCCIALLEIRCQRGYYVWVNCEARIIKDQNSKQPQFLLKNYQITSETPHQKDPQTSKNQHKNSSDTQTFIQKLQNQYNILKCIQESYQNAMFSLDLNHCYTSFNEAHRQAMKNIYGTDIKIGLNAFSFISNEKDRELANENFQKALHGEYLLQETIYGNEDLEQRYYELHYNPIRKPEGDIVGVAFIAIDTTERVIARQAELRSKKQLILLEKFVNHSHDAIQVSDTDGRLIYLNEAASVRLGISPKDAQKYRVKDFEVLFKNEEAWEAHIQNLRMHKRIVLESENKHQKTDKITQVEVTVNLKKIDGKEYVIAISRDITPKRQTELRLKELQKHLRIIVDNFPEGSISLIDRNLHFLYTGGKGYEKHGIDPNILIGQPIKHSLTEEVYEVIIEVLPDLEKEMKHSFEVNYQSMTYLNTIQAVLNEEKQMEAFVLTAVDITERKNSENLLSETNQELRAIEEELRVSQEELRANLEELTKAKQVLEDQKMQLLLIFSAAKLGAWDWDIQKGHTTYNEQWAQMLGYSLEEVTKSDSAFFELLHPDDVAKAKILVDDQKEGRSDFFQEEFRIKTKEGKWRWILDTGKVISKTENGKGLRAIGIHQDITEYKSAALALKESKEKALRIARQYQSVLDSQSVYVVKIDMNGNYSYINGYFYQLFGKGTTFIGASALTNIIEEDQEICKAIVVECIREPEKPHAVILRKRAKDDSIKGSKWEFRGVLDESGEVCEILCVGFDITEQLDNLIQTQKLLDISSEQNTKLKSFAYIVSHNIRTHAANFTGLIGLMKGAESKEEQTFYLDMLDTSATQLDQTIYNLNEIVTINENLSRPRYAINLKKAINHTLDILAGEILKHKIKINIDVADEINIEAIPAYLDSILINILSNAIKYHDLEKNPLIDISAEKTKNCVSMYVKDNGLGIDLERHKDKLFGMYKTFHNNEDARGFGLYITKTQIDAMGGKIEVESQPGIGSTFKIYFYAPN